MRRNASRAAYTKLINCLARAVVGRKVYMENRITKPLSEWFTYMDEAFLLLCLESYVTQWQCMTLGPVGRNRPRFWTVAAQIYMLRPVTVRTVVICHGCGRLWPLCSGVPSAAQCMSRTSFTRNPVQVRAVQFSSSLVGTYGCGQFGARVTVYGRPWFLAYSRVRPKGVQKIWPAAGSALCFNSNVLHC
jgi:hypothetical protein